MIIVGYKWSNFSFLFISLFYIFTFGQVLCKYFFKFIDKNLFDMSAAFSESLIQKAILIGIYSLISMHLFAIIYKLLEQSKNVENKKSIDDFELNLVKKISYILFFVSFPFAIYELYNNLTLAYSGGYQAVYSNVQYGLSSIVSKISPFFQVSLLLLIFANQKNRKTSFKWLMFSLAFNGISIVLGNRGLPILHFLSALVLWDYMFKIPKKTIFLLILLIIPLSAVISLIRVVRETSVSEWISNFGQLFVDAIGDNAFLKTINEMGTAIYPIAGSLHIYPNHLPFKYGKTFLYGLATIVPNLSSGAHWAKVGSSVNVEVASIYGAAFGGSIVEEFYANFNWIGCVLFLGFFVYIFNILEKKCINSNKCIVTILFFAFLPDVLWTVRNNAAPLFKEFVWYIFSVYILYYFIKYRSCRK